MKWTSIIIEGGLFSEEYLESLSKSDTNRPGQQTKDFGFNGKRSFVEEVSGFWGESKELFARYEKRVQRMTTKGSSSTESPYLTTSRYLVLPFLELLEYKLSEWKPAPRINDKSFPISHRDGSLPIHIVGYDISDLGDRGRGNKSPHNLVQEYLNQADEVWGIVTNGSTFRLLRNSNLFTRQTYLEVDLDKIFKEDLFDEFLLFFRLLHRTRFPSNESERDCFLETYHTGTIEEGGRVRDRLQEQVKVAIEYFGNGFLKHEENEELRKLIQEGKITAFAFYSDILYLIYRILFVLVAEERKLFGDPKHPSLTTYGMARLREIAKRAPSEDTPFDDLYRQTKTYFRILGSESLATLSGLPALGGELFRSREVIDQYDLTNRYYIHILRKLLFFPDGKALTRVNYSALNVEELGSIYESLLDFSPNIDIEKNDFSLLHGTERKSTGSHYTHSDLVSEALRQSLIPKMEEVLAEVSKESKALDPNELRKKKVEALLHLKVLDPSCGSGHFLLASARILGREIAKYTNDTDEPTPFQMREGVRQSISHNIYGVDKNPLAVDLCKTALWIEGYNLGKPLGFLDSHIRCGDSLVGVFDLSVVTPGSENFGIPDNAYTAVSGDEKSIASMVKKENSAERKNQIQTSLFQTQSSLATLTQIEYEVESIEEDSISSVAIKEKRFLESRKLGGEWWKEKLVCDLWTSAFFVPLVADVYKSELIPTTKDLLQVLQNPEDKSIQKKLESTKEIAENVRFFHWPLEFPFLQDRGFDVVVGNPPWEGLQLEEVKYFATRDRSVAELQGDARKKRIQSLRKINPKLFQEFERDKALMDKGNEFFRGSNRFPLNAVGKLNTYSLFSGLCLDLTDKMGKMSILVPTGIATDDTNKQFFGKLVSESVLSSLLDFENRKKIFPAVDSRQKFCLLSLNKAGAKETKTAFFLLDTASLFDPRRVFTLSPSDFLLFNPNTKTTPIFRTRKDYEITKKIYEKWPVLWKEDPNGDKEKDENPWDLKFKQGLFNMTSDSHLFLEIPEKNTLPLYEGKLFHQFDHRFATYIDPKKTRDVTEEEKSDPNFAITPRYWVKESDVIDALTVNEKGEKRLQWDRKWFLGWRDIARSTDERTMITSIMPWAGVGNKSPIILTDFFFRLYLLQANLSSLVYDFVARQKLGGTTMNYFYFKQINAIPKDSYSNKDRSFILPRVCELVYTSHELQPFVEDLADEAKELGVSLPQAPYVWNSERRAVIRAELDAYYAKLYGLTREELLYILDPQDAMGEDWPSETFRGLKEGEIREFGEYRTKRLVLEAWERV